MTEKDWSYADILTGRNIIQSGPRRAKFCPGCGSPNIEHRGSISNSTDSIRCTDCGARFGGASARA